MTEEQKIKILSGEIASRKVELVQLESEIKTFEMMIERVDEVVITEDSIEFKPEKDNG